MSLRNKIEELLLEQKLAVLGTYSGFSPHTTLVAFTANLKELKALFVTTSISRKAKNINKNPHVSLLVDNRGNNITDFRDTCVVTLEGIAEEASEADVPNFLSKHPYLLDFLNAPSTKLYRINLEKVEVVTHFQNVYELDLND